jgi:PfaD family protein
VKHDPAFSAAELLESVRAIRQAAYVIHGPDGRLGVGIGGRLLPTAAADGYRVVGVFPPLYPELLGDPGFCRAHGVRWGYVAGAMANGIATTDLVEAMCRAGMLGFFGAAGLPVDKVEHAMAVLSRNLAGRQNWGVNLIHSPGMAGGEEDVVDLVLRHRVPRVCASAYLALTPAVVRCAASGLRTDQSGRIVRSVGLFAKVSRPEVAEKFLSPAPESILRGLVAAGSLTSDEARLAARVPVATDVTVEADSGGHTDNRPLAVILPVIRDLRDVLTRRFGYLDPPRIGAAGGLGCPAGVAAAFAAGAAYVLTGSINQLAVEAGISVDAKAMLAGADVADVMMAPAADMFEMGVKVQVLRRGTMFAARATRLYEIYRSYSGLEAIPPTELARLERTVLHARLDQVWADTERFWAERDPEQLKLAAGDPKHRMALAFRWYLGMSSQWAIEGLPERRTDYQLWAGPAVGAFNRWTAGTFLAVPENRSVTQIAHSLMEGAALITRAHQLRTAGVPIPPAAFSPAPTPMP